MEPLHHHFEERVITANNVCWQRGGMNGIRRDELDRGICGCQVRGGIAAMPLIFVNQKVKTRTQKIGSL